MTSYKTVLLALGLSSLAMSARAFEPQTFDYKDWELVCDNTATCRAVGYHADSGEYAGISLLLTRQAGSSNVTAKLRIIDWEGGGEPNVRGAMLYLNGKSLGALNFKDEVAALSSTQTKTILTSLKGKSQIEVRTHQQKWRLSDAGSSAVLSKMDDIQGRVGTPSALVATGNSNQAVLAAQKPPVIYAAAVSTDKPATFEVDSKTYQEFVRSLTNKTLGDNDEVVEDCQNDGYFDKSLTRYPLSNGHWLWSLPCFMGAYQGTDYYTNRTQNILQYPYGILN
ncbi:MAG: DUF1176 domain-containing protein, partial [Moraxella sp.]|nr:DUF1176 domain-containing protein [Moraxella sp.]